MWQDDRRFKHFKISTITLSCDKSLKSLSATEVVTMVIHLIV